MNTWPDKYQTEIDDLEPGQTLRFNHDNCPAGEDTRRRLYVTRPHADPTTVLWYCHNCSDGGRISDTPWGVYRNNKHTSVVYPTAPIVRDAVEEPTGLIYKVTDWPSHAYAWAAGNNLSQELCAEFGIQYDPSTNRVYIPSHCKGHLIGYQLRNTDPCISGPKYLTVRKDDAPSWTCIFNEHADWAVIVEDMVSGIHVHTAWKYDSNGGLSPNVFVTHGTKVDPSLMYNVAMKHKEAVVWLDNDNDHVIEQAKTMERTIALYNEKMIVRRTKVSDPKHFAYEDIRRVCDGQH